MKAVVMAGGRGERLMPLTATTPKPMLKLLNKPMMVYAVDLLKKAGVKDIAVTLGYLPEQIIEYFGNGEKFGVRMKYFIEKEPLGTAGGVKNCAPFLTDENFVVASADGYTEMDLKKAVAFHERKDSLFTVVCKMMDDPVGLGVLERDDDGVIKAFLEKPVGVKRALVNTGIYIVNRRVLDMIPDGFYDFGKQLLPALTGTAYAYRDDAYWSDLGTVERYRETEEKLRKEFLHV